MNRRLLTVLLLAFLIAGGCSLLVYRVVGRRVAAGHQGSTTRVIAAATDIKLGTILTAANLSSTEIAGTLPKGAILKPENAIGRGVVADLYQGEPIMESRLAPLGSGGGLAATIRQGMRACAVKVDEVVGVAGFVTPGMRVDVLISGDPPGVSQAQGTMVRTLLQNIQVLSAGTDIQKDTEGKPQQVRVVNLLVTPEQAEVLSLASNPNNQTHIQLVLRNPLDTQESKVTGSAMVNLFGNAVSTPLLAHVVAPSGATRKPAPQSYSIEVLNGSQRTEQKIAAPEAKE
jgi:pilus assembly protein CpaB